MGYTGLRVESDPISTLILNEDPGGSVDTWNIIKQHRISGDCSYSVHTHTHWSISLQSVLTQYYISV